MTDQHHLKGTFSQKSFPALRLLALALALFILSGCGGSLESFPRESQPESAAGDSFIPLEAGTWPENLYTRALPQPASGTVQNGWIDWEKSYCYIELTGMEEGGPQAYLEALYAAGFETLEQVSEEIQGQGYLSAGILLSDGETELSISYHRDLFGIYIHLTP